MICCIILTINLCKTIIYTFTLIYCNHNFIIFITPEGIPVIQIGLGSVRAFVVVPEESNTQLVLKEANT